MTEKENSTEKGITHAGQIYKNGHRYGGFYTGMASDTSFIPNGTIFKSKDVQGALSEISDILKSNDSSTGTIKKISIGTNPSSSKEALMITWIRLDDGTEQTSYINFTDTI